MKGGGGVTVVRSRFITGAMYSAVSRLQSYFDLKCPNKVVGGAKIKITSVP